MPGTIPSKRRKSFSCKLKVGEERDQHTKTRRYCFAEGDLFAFLWYQVGTDIYYSANFSSGHLRDEQNFIYYRTW